MVPSTAEQECVGQVRPGQAERDLTCPWEMKNSPKSQRLVQRTPRWHSPESPPAKSIPAQRIPSSWISVGIQGWFLGSRSPSGCTHSHGAASAAPPAQGPCLVLARWSGRAFPASMFLWFCDFKIVGDETLSRTKPLKPHQRCSPGELRGVGRAPGD